MFFGKILVWGVIFAIILTAIKGNRDYLRARFVEEISKMSFHEVMYKILQPPSRGFHPEVVEALLKQGAMGISIFSSPDMVRKFYKYARQHPVPGVTESVEQKVPRLLAA